MTFGDRGGRGDRRGGGGGRFGDRRSGNSRGGGFGGGFRPRQDRPMREAPVKVGEEYDVDILDKSQRGDGIAKVKNFVVFVPGTNKGDKVRIRIKEVRGTSATGEIVEGEGSESSEESAPAEGAESDGEFVSMDKESEGESDEDL